MAHVIIDRRKSDKGKSSVNRQRFVKRVRDQVREAVKDTIINGDIKDITDNKGKKIRIPGKGLDQPEFHHSPNGGIKDRVYPGNDRYVQGDREARPEQSGGSGGSKGSQDGEGTDEFDFHLTKEEFLDLFFEDLELPDLVRKSISKIEEFEWKRSGFSVDGNPSRLNILQSMRKSKGRRIALRTPKRKQLKELNQQLDQIQQEIDQTSDEKLLAELEEKRVQLLDQIKLIKSKIKAIPLIDDTDLRYNRWDKVPVPTTQAVMFCIMDVSASMGQWEKEMAKRFFMLLYLFLVRNYKRVEIVFIRHHTSAKEVDEDEFFYSKESGGTIMSTALDLMKQIVEDRYSPSQWNVFVCQASDGDNWSGDNEVAVETITKSILPVVQYFAYIELNDRGDRTSDIWPQYKKLSEQHDNMNMNIVRDITDIYPVFRKLFEKRTK